MNNRKLPTEPRSIVLIARKYDLDPKLLIEAFTKAWGNKMKTHKCGILKVACRGENQDYATFLITNEEVVVSQFPIKLEVLKNLDSLMSLVQIPASIGKEEVKERKRKIGELRFRMKGVDVRAKVVKISPKQAVLTGFGVQAYVSNVSIADETGAIMLSLWNSQIDRVHVGDEVEIENGYVARYAGELQLRMGRSSALSVINQPEMKTNSP